MKPGDIVISKSGQKQRITRDYSTGWYETDIGGLYRDEIDCVIGTKCFRCETEVIFNDGYYRLHGEHFCVPCGERKYGLRTMETANDQAEHQDSERLSA